MYIHRCILIFSHVFQVIVVRIIAVWDEFVLRKIMGLTAVED